jgi:hypothetical protein
MSKVRLFYTAAVTLYGAATKVAGAGTALTEDGTYPGVYEGDTATPYVYHQAGGSPATSDAFVAKIDEVHYGTIEGGDLYHQTRVHAWDWENATTEDKLKALYTATQAMDKFCFVGVKTDDDQGLEFPRTRTLSDGTVNLIGGVAGIPSGVVDAAYLIADALVGGRDPQADFESQNVKVETFGPVRTEFATNRAPQQHIANLIPSASAWALILPFLGISTSFTVDKG